MTLGNAKEDANRLRDLATYIDKFYPRP
jgi:hypothetical protein